MSNLQLVLNAPQFARKSVKVGGKSYIREQRGPLMPNFYGSLAKELTLDCFKSVFLSNTFLSKRNSHHSSLFIYFNATDLNKAAVSQTRQTALKMASPS